MPGAGLAVKMDFMIQTWRITPTQTLQLDLKASTLDEVTRQLPEGYYSTFRTFDGGRRVLGLTSHLQRLYEPVTTPEIDEASLRRQMAGLLELYQPGEARLRVVMTREGQAYLSIAPFSVLPRQVYEKGVRVETTELSREQPRLKSTTFIGRSEAERSRLANEGIFEALLVRAGEILEGMTSNFFYAMYPRAEGEVVLGTAQDGILPGITRETVLAIAQSRGFSLRYQPLKLSQLHEVRETFITSSSRGVVPVVQIDARQIGEGAPGAVTREMLAAYEAHVLEVAEEI